MSCRTYSLPASLVSYEQNNRRHSIKTLIAGLLSALIFWAILPDNPPTQLKIQEPQVVKTTQVDKASAKLPAKERTQAKPEAVEPVGEVSEKQNSDTQTATEGNDMNVLTIPEPTEPKAIAQAKATEYGWTGDQWQALEQLWHKESGWNPAAYNASSGACGIPQAVPCTKIPNPTDVHSQLEWGMNYIKSRYGSPTKALAFWHARVPIDGHDVGNWY